MPKLAVDLSIKEIEDVILQLTPAEIERINENIKNKLETKEIMKLAESSFLEWNRMEEDIYNE